MTPDTLTVESGLQQEYSFMSVPQINFTSGKFVELGPKDKYYSAADLVAQIDVSTAAQGSILSIIPPVTNISYTKSFYGPALSCTPANETTLLALRAASGMRNTDGQQVVYAAWVLSPAYPNITTPNLYGSGNRCTTVKEAVEVWRREGALAPLSKAVGV